MRNSTSCAPPVALPFAKVAGLDQPPTLPNRPIKTSDCPGAGSAAIWLKSTRVHFVLIQGTFRSKLRHKNARSSTSAQRLSSSWAHDICRQLRQKSRTGEKAHLSRVRNGENAAKLPPKKGDFHGNTSIPGPSSDA